MAKRRGAKRKDSKADLVETKNHPYRAEKIKGPSDRQQMCRRGKQSKNQGTNSLSMPCERRIHAGIMSLKRDWN